MNAEQIKQLIEQYKSEADALISENKLEDAEAKTVEVKILKGQLDIQEKLEVANAEIEELNSQITKKNESISNLNSDLEDAKAKQTEAMNNFNEATGNIAELNAKVTEMSPIVEQHNKDLYENKLNVAKEDYKNKFQKLNATEIFEDEEVQNLIVNSIEDDEAVSTKARYELSQKLLATVDLADASSIPVGSIQERTKQTKNLNAEQDEFEAMYGFKKN